MVSVYVNKYVAKKAVCRIFFSLQTAKVAYFQRKIQFRMVHRPNLSGLVDLYCI
jgi:hypothetical protein